MKTCFHSILFIVSVLVISSCNSIIELDDLYWVHYTNVCPRSAQLIPGSVPIHEDDKLDPKKWDEVLAHLELMPERRGTLHGVISGAVVAHEGMVTVHKKLKGPQIVDRSGYAYAVMIPLPNITSYIVGGFHQDLYALGPLPLDETCHLVMRHDAPAPKGVSCHIHQLTSEVPLFSGVEALLRAGGKPVIHYSLDAKEGSRGDEAKFLTLTAENFDAVLEQTPLEHLQVLFKAPLDTQEGWYEHKEKILSNPIVQLRLLGKREYVRVDEGKGDHADVLLPVIYTRWDGWLFHHSPLGILDNHLHASVLEALVLCQLYLQRPHGTKGIKSSFTVEALESDLHRAKALFAAVEPQVHTLPASSQEWFYAWHVESLWWLKEIFDYACGTVPKGGKLRILSIDTPKAQASCRRFLQVMQQKFKKFRVEQRKKQASTKNVRQ